MRLTRLFTFSWSEAILSLMIAALAFSPLASAASSANVTATVTIQNVSVAVTDGSVAYTTVSTSGNADTTSNGVNDSQTATNDGNVTEDLNIRGADSTSWTLAATAGSEQYAHKFCITTCDTTPTWTALTTSNQTLAASVATSGTQVFDLQFLAPTATTQTAQESLTVTVQASAS
ncbi:MAG: hypothetical protein UY13_C0002G0138 [Candidatus Pacebacteria bacterium GW2011_GWB1_47_8]|nr:MAG: hypothetical protein UX28_C0001G0287 [Candidatus Pacebacteria bacterium GW2011_GWA1_46_10]KKU84226.1 MAG: hypothetical protein UY13_C0002G0138 [Candidatus Pacebacteria bacterium GW2011_GWB1_47_8]HCR81446.1 hypothetical protein [Candidatus Paceibacterota bacterium]